MKRYIKIFISMIVVVNLALTGISFANTPDGETPAVETVCDGLSGSLHGLCNAYCEAMDCDSANPKASAKACSSVLKNWNRRADGQTLPCLTDAGISLVKKVNGITETNPNNNPIDVGTSIVYTFEIHNSGNVDLTGITLSDPTLTVGITCNPTQPISLAVGESATCTSDSSSAEAGAHSNTATVNGQSIYNDPVSDSSTTSYYGMEVETTECPCASAWNSFLIPPLIENADFSNGTCTFDLNAESGRFITATDPSLETTWSILTNRGLSGPDYCSRSMPNSSAGVISPTGTFLTNEERLACKQYFEELGCNFSN